MNEILAAVQLYLRVCGIYPKPEKCPYHEASGEYVSDFEVEYYGCKLQEAERAAGCDRAKADLIRLSKVTK